jgi:hypothetical protein
MNENELKQLWQKQPVPAPTATPAAAPGRDTIDLMKQKMRKLNRTLFWRDARELIVCAVIIVWFGADLFSGIFNRSLAHFFGPQFRHANSTLAQIGDVVLVLSAVLIGAKLLLARRTSRAFLQPSSVREFLGGELEKVNRQIRLLRTVLWWYLLPVFCGVALIFIGADRDVFSDVVVLTSIAASFGVIYWVNLHAVRKTLLPMKVELEEALGAMAE